MFVRAWINSSSATYLVFQYLGLGVGDVHSYLSISILYQALLGSHFLFPVVTCSRMEMIRLLWLFRMIDGMSVSMKY